MWDGKSDSRESALPPATPTVSAQEGREQRWRERMAGAAGAKGPDDVHTIKAVKSTKITTPDRPPLCVDEVIVTPRPHTCLAGMERGWGGF